MKLKREDRAGNMNGWSPAKSNFSKIVREDYLFWSIYYWGMPYIRSSQKKRPRRKG